MPQERPSLDCGRDEEWCDVETLYKNESHAVAVVTGPVGEAHDHFLRRIQYGLPHTTPRLVEWVNWRPRPASRDEFRESLAEALDVDQSALAETLRRRLSTHNLVLMHDIVDGDYDDVELRRYYVQWLPELVAEVAPRRMLICVQPVAWRNSARGLANWLQRILGTPAADLKTEAELAADFVRSLSAPSPLLQARLEVPLTSIADGDVERFCRRHLFPAADAAEILRCARRGPRTRSSEAVLRAVDVCVDTHVSHRAAGNGEN